MINGAAPVGPPTVSVIIAAYNAAEFIERAIGSVWAQDGVECEVVIADDGSTDATLALVQGLARHDPRIRVVALSVNRGAATARNAALDAAAGEWAAVLDADDAFMPGRLAHLLSVARTSGADAVADNFVFFDTPAGRPIRPGLLPAEGSGAPETIGLQAYIDRSRPYRAEADYGLLKPMFRRAFLERHRLRYPICEGHAEDFLIIVELLLAGARYVLTRRPGYLYTTRSSGMSRVRVSYQALVRDTEKLLQRDGIAGQPMLRAALQRRIRALRRIAAEHGVRRLVDGRDALGLAGFAMTDWRVTIEMLRFLKHRLAP